MRRKYRRVGFTAAQSAELWERWKKGEGLKSIGRVFGKPSSCIFAHIRPSGGIMPPVRRRSRLALTLGERGCLVQTDDPQTRFEPVGAMPVLWNDAEWLDAKRRP